jgi:Leucine rich repeat/Secretion system C-terminal sorting domain
MTKATIMRLKALLFLLLITLLINPFKTEAQVNKQDSLALVALYKSTKGPGWKDHTNWLTKASVSTWHGVEVTTGRVTSLFLDNNQLNGSIPNSLGSLSNLRELYLNDNQLSGSIPSSLGNLSYLTILYLEGNQLNDSIPSSLQNLKNLTSLLLRDNQLSGSIPNSLGSLSNLKDLYLNNNQLSGSIPSSFGDLNSLINLVLYNNQLSGSIPSSFSKLYNLTVLDLNTNNLTGPIPSFLGNLDKLVVLVLANNKFSGSIPSTLGNLNKLHILNLFKNELSGDIPSSIGKLSNSLELYLSNNQFTFAALEPFVPIINNNTTISIFVYAPQSDIPITFINDKLYISPGGTKDTVRWYKAGDSNPVAVTTDTSFTPLTSGKYYATAINKVAKDLTLHSDTVTVSIILPVTLVDFKATLLKENRVLLNWQTATEKNTAYFEVQRSIDGIRFKSVAKVAATGNSTTVQSYQYADDLTSLEKIPPVVFYRLNIRDKDGADDLSNVITVKPQQQTAVSLKAGPNPVENILHVTYTSNADQMLTLRVLNIAGKVIITKQVRAVQGVNNYELLFNNVAKGEYLLQIAGSESLHAVKVVKAE